MLNDTNTTKNSPILKMVHGVNIDLVLYPTKLGVRPRGLPYKSAISYLRSERQIALNAIRTIQRSDCSEIGNGLRQLIIDETDCDSVFMIYTESDESLINDLLADIQAQMQPALV